MNEVFLDVFSLHRLAKGIKARQSALDAGKSEEEAAAAFQSITFMCYDPKQSITALEEHDNLVTILIDLLEVELQIRHQLIIENKDIDTAALIRTRDAKWERYEFVRRMTAFEYNSLIVDRKYS